MAGTVAPNIVTDGLVLYLDAANVKSYVSGSTTWVDIAAGNNVTLTNGPTFNSGNNGSIVFDGTNDYVQVTSPFGDIASGIFTGVFSSISVLITDFEKYSICLIEATFRRVFM
jgi:hypothetical protein